MKTKYIFRKTLALSLLFSYNTWSQSTICQWNFNGPSATTIPGGEISPTTSLGTGTAQLVGGTTATYASGVAGSGSSDTVLTSPNNYGWNTTAYAALGTENKQRGVQFNFSTIGLQGIHFRFDQRLSNTSSNTYIVQYTTDRTVSSPTWTDAQTFTLPQGLQGTTGGDVWHNLRSVDLSTITSLNNNPNVAIRVVSAFDPGTANYLSSTGTANNPPYSYLTTGTVRYDMVTITANSALTISEFENTKNNFKIYPNPSNKELVQFNQSQNISVYNYLGKLVFNAKNTMSLDTKSFVAGVYFIKLDSGITSKLIVK